MYRCTVFKLFIPFMLMLLVGPVSALDIIRSKNDIHQGSIGISTNGLGQSIVVWGQCGNVASCSRKESSVYAQRVDSGGNKIGAILALNSFTSGINPKVLYKDDGSFSVAWETEPDAAADNTETKIYARLFDSQALPLMPEFRIDGDDSAFEFLTNIDSLSNGNLIVYWSESGGASGTLFRREFQSNGIFAGAREDISMTALGSQASFSQFGNVGYYTLAKEASDSVTLFSTVPFSVADLLPQQLNTPFSGITTSLLSAVNTTNGFVAGWEQRASSTDRELYITMTQNDQYVAERILVTDNLFLRPSLNINENGKVLVSRSEGSQVVANLYSNLGILENNSVQLDGNPVTIYDSQMSTDNISNFITAWSGSVDTSSTLDYVIRMQKIDADGVILWSSNTQTVTTPSSGGSGGGGGSAGLLTFLFLLTLIFIKNIRRFQ